MKILMLSQGWRIEDQPDFDVAFRTATSESIELKNIPFRAYIAEHGETAFYKEIVSINEEFRPDVIFFQFFHGGCSGRGLKECCQEIRNSRNRPLIFGSLGDLYYTGWEQILATPIPFSLRSLAANADAFFSTSMGNIADKLVKSGGRNIIFLPNAFCTQHFPYWDRTVEEFPEYDVVMLCSKGRLIGRRPMVSVRTQWKRRYVVYLLAREFGDRFAVFGRNWRLSGGDVSVGIPFSEQVRYYQRSRVVVDAPAAVRTTDYYSSDRAFFMLGSGTPLVHCYTPRFDKMLRPDEHAYYAYRLHDVPVICKKLLDFPSSFLAERRKKIQQFVREHHLISHRVDTIISVAQAIQMHRREEVSDRDALRFVRMHHFLPEVDLEKEYQYCIRNWVG